MQNIELAMVSQEVSEGYATPKAATPRAIIQIIPTPQGRLRSISTRRQQAAVVGGQTEMAPQPRGVDAGAQFAEQIKLGPPCSACGRNLVRDTCSSLSHPRDRKHPLVALTSSKICSSKPSSGWPRQVHQQAKRLTVVASHNPAAAAYLRSKRSSGLPAGLEPANMFNRQFGG